MNKIAILVCQNETVVMPYDNADYIAVDAGYNALIRAQLPIKVLIGDLDSVETKVNIGCEIEQFDVMKDETDTHLAIKYAKKMGYDKIIIQGVTTNRMDHFLNVLQLLYVFEEMNIEIVDERNKIFLHKGESFIDNCHKYISFFSFTKSTVTATGLLYELNDYCISPLTFQSISNQIIDSKCFVKTDLPIIIFQSY